MSGMMKRKPVRCRRKSPKLTTWTDKVREDERRKGDRERRASGERERIERRERREEGKMR